MGLSSDSDGKGRRASAWATSLLLLACSSVPAEYGCSEGEAVIRGTVLSVETGQPLAFHEVVTSSHCGTVVDTTEEAGAFALQTSPGNHHIGILDVTVPFPSPVAVGRGETRLPARLVRSVRPELASLSAVECSSEPGFEVGGSVADVFTSRPLQHAQAYLAGLRCGMLTDSVGRFRMSGAEDGDTLVVELIGYRAVRIPLSDVEPMRRTFRIGLIQAPVALSH